MSVLCVGNPSSGSADEEILRSVVEQLAPLGDVEPFVASSASAFEDELRHAAKGHALVVVAGGDGTLSLSVNALHERLDDVIFGLVPMGTGNDLARTLGLDSDPADTAAGLVRGHTVELDVGRASGPSVERLFVNACVGGFSVAVDESVDDREKKRFGPLAFWLGAVRAARDVTRYTVTIDDRTIEDVVAVGIGNGRSAGGGLPLWPDALPSDGVLDGCAVRAPSLPTGLRAAAKIRAARHVDDEHVVAFTGSHIAIEAEPMMELNVDGELVGLRTPAIFEVARQFKLMLPGPRR